MKKEDLQKYTKDELYDDILNVRIMVNMKNNKI